MASENKNLPDCGIEFEVDGDERVHTLMTPGGKISNSGGVDFVITTRGQPIDGVAQPVGPGHAYVPVGSTHVLPKDCVSIRAKSTAGSTFAHFSKE